MTLPLEVNTSLALAIATGTTTKSLAYIATDGTIFAGDFHRAIAWRFQLDEHNWIDGGRFVGGTPSNPRIEVVGRAFELPIPTSGRRRVGNILRELLADQVPPIPVIERSS